MWYWKLIERFAKCRLLIYTMRIEKLMFTLQLCVIFYENGWFRMFVYSWIVVSLFNGPFTSEFQWLLEEEKLVMLYWMVMKSNIDKFKFYCYWLIKLLEFIEVLWWKTSDCLMCWGNYSFQIFYTFILMELMGESRIVILLFIRFKLFLCLCILFVIKEVEKCCVDERCEIVEWIV